MQEVRDGLVRAARLGQTLMAVDVRDQQARVRDLQPDGERANERRRRVVGGVRHYDVGMRPGPPVELVSRVIAAERRG